MLISWDWEPTSTGLFEGDSRDDLKFQFQQGTLVKTFIRSRYALAGSLVVPSITIDAVNGSLFGTILARLPGEIATVNPTHFLLDAGVNNVDHPELRTLQGTLDDLAAILDLTAAVGIKTLCTLPFWSNDTMFPGATGRIPIYNAAMAGVISGYDNAMFRDLYVELNGPVNGPSNYTVDQIHPNLAGKRAYRNLCATVIQCRVN